MIMAFLTIAHPVFSSVYFYLVFSSFTQPKLRDSAEPVSAWLLTVSFQILLPLKNLLWNSCFSQVKWLKCFSCLTWASKLMVANLWHAHHSEHTEPSNGVPAKLPQHLPSSRVSENSAPRSRAPAREGGVLPGDGITSSLGTWSLKVPPSLI